MKGQAISGNLLTLPFFTLFILTTAACFTIVTDGTRQPDQSTDFIPQGSEVSSTSSSSDSLSPDQDSGSSYELELIVDPNQAAKFAVSPKPNSRGAYSVGTEVTIEVLPNPGWEIQQWVGPAYAISGNVAKVNIDQDQTVLVRMVRAD